MSYTPPPTFVDDAVLSAAQLNILGDDIAYLYGLSQAVNAPLPRERNASGINGVWLFRHRCRYLYASIGWVNTPGQPDYPLAIDYGADRIVDTFLSGTNGRNDYQIDLDPLGLTIGDFYEVTIASVTGSVFGTYIELNYLYEADV